jgi:rhodanese-related sulfurtransferase
MKPNEIGYFQFDNLVQNRVPFVLLSFDIDFSAFYSLTVPQRHLESQLISSSKDKAIEVLKSKSIAPETPIVLVCSQGKVSGRVASLLEKKGFTNVFLVQGGYEALMKDRP